MCDGDYKFVVWVQRLCLPLVWFPLIPHGGDEHDGLVHEGLLCGTNSNSKIFERAGNSMESSTEPEGVTIISCFIVDHLAGIINAMHVQDEKSLWVVLLEGISCKRKDWNRD